MRGFKGFAVLAAPVLLIGCFFLPNAVSGITDMKNIDSLTVIEAQSLSLLPDVRLGLAERLILTANSNSESLQLKKGKTMDQETAYTCAFTELRRFFNASGLGPELDGYEVEGGAAAFIIDSEDPSVNMVVWTIQLSNEYGHSISVTLDDETGTIMQLDYWKKAGEPYLKNHARFPEDTPIVAEDDILYESAAQLAGLMADYYGMPVLLDDYMRNGEFSYYRADLYSGTAVLPLYGVVRDTGFSMNERV